MAKTEVLPLISFIKFIMLSDADGDGSFWQTRVSAVLLLDIILYVKEWVQQQCLLWSDHILQSQMPNWHFPSDGVSLGFHALLGLCIVLEPRQFLAWYTVISQGFSSFCNISIHKKALCVSSHYWTLNQLAVTSHSSQSMLSSAQA